MKLVIPRPYSNEEIVELIDKYIHDERDRNILKRRFCDKRKYERLAEDFELSRSQIWRIIEKGLLELLPHL